MSAINAALPGWSTAAQARHTLTIARTPGATPGATSGATSGATPGRVVMAPCVALPSPALPGALPGILTGPAQIHTRHRSARILDGESA